jgi:hypothetical protein
MNQMIPDGLQVKLSIYKDDMVVDEIFKSSKDGFVIFTINKNIFKHNVYNLKITAAGIAKTFENINYD